MNICIIAVGASSIIEAQNICRSWDAGTRPGRCRLQAHYVGSDSFSENDWPAVFRSLYESDFALIDTMGVPQDFSEALAEGVSGYQGHIVVANATTVAVRSLTRLGGFSLRMMRRMDKGKGGAPDTARMMKMIEMMERLGRTLPIGPLRDMRNFLWISRYWLYGTRCNIENMLYLIGREYFNCSDFPKPEPPALIDDGSIMDPVSGRVFSTLAAYRQAFPPAGDKPALGLFFRSRTYPLDTHPVIARVAERLSAWFNVIPVTLDSTVGRDFDRLRTLLMPEGRPAVDVIVNPESFRLAQGPMGGEARNGELFLRDLNVPVLHPFLLTKRSFDQWHSDDRGAEVGEFLISIFLPELDGCIEMYPFGAVGTPHDRTPELAPIDDRIEHVVQRARRWSQLRRKPNTAKRLAVIIYNYPPGAGTVGSSTFLDTFASLSALLEKLATEGYDVRPLSADDLHTAFVGRSANNALEGNGRPSDGRITVDEKAYRSLTGDLPGMERIANRWGAFPGDTVTHDKKLTLPGILCGNVFIGLQPPRTFAESRSVDYHDKNLPPHHQYAAFYRWIERVFRADALVHVGTHGTLEFLPGKEKAASKDCFADALVGELPHVYVYYSGNPSEAMIAKRRSHAVTIGHLPPAFKRGELYEELQHLRQLADEYQEALSLNPGRCPVILDDIRSCVDALGWEWIGLDDVHRRLHEMNAALVPARLHTLGRGFSEAETVEHLAEFFRSNAAGAFPLYEQIARSRGFDWQAVFSEPHRYAEQWEELDRLARQWISAHVLHGVPLESDAAVDSAAAGTIVKFGEAAAKALMHNSELDAVVRALSGGYIEPGLSGDLFRSPEVLPTGRNLVQFDPRQVPSPSAVRQGEAIAERTIEHYHRINGRYPSATAVILWGLETSQTQGETVGQILACLGVRVVRVQGQWDPQLELVPLEELGRPRIDVTVQICGFFRDMFPNALELLQRAFDIVGFADEPDDMNSIRAHSRLLFGDLRARGMEEPDAREFALARVFGPAASEYGTGVERIVKDRTWQDEGDLVGAYIDSLKHAYTPNHYGREMDSLLTDNLSRVEVVSQVRSSRDYEMTDLDHYYEFFGGLARSVEQASGSRAVMLVSDTHEGRVRTEDIGDAIQRGIHTRLINTNWLDGMLSHRHHGGQEIAKRMENLIGLAATTGAVGQKAFDQINRRLVFDDAMRERIQENNPYAMLEIVERLWEAKSRGYWQPDDETLDRLKEIYLGVETHLEGLQR